MKKIYLNKTKNMNLSVVLLIGIILVSFLSLNSQSKIDSLVLLVTGSNNDSLSYEASIKLGYYYESSDFDSALKYYENAIELASVNNWDGLLARAYINTGFAYKYVLGSFKSIEFLEKGIEIYAKINDKNGLMDSYYNLGFFYSDFEKYPNAIINYKKAIELAIELEDDQRLGMIYNNIGLLYQYIGAFDKANEYQFNALRIKQNIVDNTISYTYLNIGLNYLQQKEYDKALEHYLIALDSLLILGDDEKVALCYNNIGKLYFEKGDWENAFDNYDLAYDLYIRLSDTASISGYYLSRGNVYMANGDLSKANSSFKSALNIFPKNGNKRSLFFIYKSLTELNLIFSEEVPGSSDRFLRQALSYAKSMLNISLEIGSLSLENSSNKILWKIYKELDNTRKALLYAGKYISLNDSLVSEQKQQIITDIQIKYETEKNILEVELLNKENELISTRLSESNSTQRNQRNLITILALGFIIITGFIVVIYRYFIKTKKANNKLVAKNEIIENQKNKIELLFKEIHHRVKNNLQIISSLIELQMVSIDDQSTKDTLIDAQSRLKSIATIHEVLYQKDEKEKVDFEHFVHKLVDQILLTISNTSDIEIDIDFDENVYFSIDKTMPLGLILNELITNSVKHAFQNVNNPKLSIRLHTDNKSQYKIIVSDNGVGLPDDFNFDTTESLGLKLVVLLADQIAGNITYDSGSTFTITFDK